jgi:2-polyprenyl-3-methyl-5-hydroxy-6-metoxy-1,4-benzoquinol methylase
MPNQKIYKPEGVPTTQQYESLLASEEFKIIEKFSNSFLDANAAYLSDYAKKWVKDPLHQWSRQWEYLFVFDKCIESFRLDSNSCEPKTKTLNILDAGSGITFFPYFLKNQFAFADLYCCDYDSSLEDVYQIINGNTKVKVNFTLSDLRKLSFPDGFFDAIYCISVLEHTDNYGEIIDEFFRVMKPGSNLILTFDVSLDGEGDISPEGAKKLLTALRAKFSSSSNIDDLDLLLSKPVNLTTSYAAKINQHLIPWRRPSFMRRVKDMIRNRRISNWPPPYIVYCASFEKLAA